MLSNCLKNDSDRISKHVQLFLEHNTNICLKYYRNVSKTIPTSFKQCKTLIIVQKWSKPLSKNDFKMVPAYLYDVPKITLKESNEAFGQHPTKNVMSFR